MRAPRSDRAPCREQARRDAQLPSCYSSRMLIHLDLKLKTGGCPCPALCSIPHSFAICSVSPKCARFSAMRHLLEDIWKPRRRWPGRRPAPVSSHNPQRTPSMPPRKLLSSTSTNYGAKPRSSVTRFCRLSISSRKLPVRRGATCIGGPRHRTSWTPPMCSSFGPRLISSTAISGSCAIVSQTSRGSIAIPR